MIASIEGEITIKNADSIVIEVGGIGYQVYAPTSMLHRLESGNSAFLHTKLIIREDNWSLYGFENLVEKEYFELLLGVSGVGPKSALAVLSVLTIDQIRSAVLSDQPDAFAKVPGVGRKTGQKIILHLQGKVGDSAAVIGGVTVNSMDIDLLEALTGLGYSIAEAQKAIQSIPMDTPNDMEERLRAALHFFNR